MNTDSITGTVVPAVWTFNDSAWTSTVFGPTNLSNQVPYFVDVAAQGQYVDALFVNQPPGLAQGYYGLLRGPGHLHQSHGELGRHPAGPGDLASG